jgi:hypothetical protein
MGTTAAAPLRSLYLTDEELAQQLPNCNRRKLRNWRALRVGPPWFLCGREICYLVDSVQIWMRDSQTTAICEQPVRTVRPRKPKKHAQ